MFSFKKAITHALDTELGKVREANVSALDGLLNEINGLLHAKPSAPVIPIDQAPRVARERRSL